VIRCGPAAACVAAIAAVAPPAYAEPVRLIVDAPAAAPGDGATPIRVHVRVEPAAAVTKLEDLELSVDAGVAGEPAPGGVHGIAFDVTPPNIVRDRPLTVVATARIGTRKLRAQTVLTLEPTAADVPMREFSVGGYAPERVRLGIDESVELTGISGRVFASTGTVTAPNERGVVGYTPPATTAPQVAFIVQTSNDVSQVWWTPVPLVGLGELHLQSEPFASVVVLVNDRTFGPVRTDAKGEARLYVEAPPGAIVAETIATDEVGNVSTGTLPLAPPPFARMFALCPEGVQRALIFAVDETGTPLREAAIDVDVAGGATQTTSRVSGAWAVDYVPAIDAQPGDRITVRAAFADDPSVEAECTSVVPQPTIVEIAPPIVVPPRRRKAISFAVSLGYLHNLGKVAGPLVSAAVAYRLPALRERVSVGLDLGFYTSEDTRAVDGQDVVTSVTAAPVLATAAYAYPVDPVSIYASAGAGAVIADRELSSMASGREAHRGLRPAIAAAIGGRLPAGPGSAAVELGYLYAPVSDPNLEGNAGGFRVTVGYWWAP
jgi:hypothetical protein